MSMEKAVGNIDSSINIEVAYAMPESQILLDITVPLGTTAMQAVEQSGVLQQFPKIDLATSKLGIFARVLGTQGTPEPNMYELREGDRVEIYRPLILDPKEIRRRRAETARKKKDASES